LFSGDGLHNQRTDCAIGPHVLWLVATAPAVPDHAAARSRDDSRDHRPASFREHCSSEINAAPTASTPRDPAHRN
jgi:hypothetical protein